MESTQIQTAGIAQISVGAVLSRAWATLMKRPGIFFGLACLALVPPAILEGLLPGKSANMAQVMGGIFALMMQGATAYAVYQLLRHQNVSFNEALTHGTARIGSLVLTAALTTLGIVLGIVVLIIPGVILACMWAVTIPVCVVERLGPIDSIKRSAQLTKGHRLPMFGVVCIPFVIMMLCALVVGFASEMLIENDMVLGILISLALIVPQAFNSVVIVTAYSDLRAIKDGVALEGLANIFD